MLAGKGGWGQPDCAGMEYSPGRSPEMTQTATSCAGTNNMGSWYEGREVKEEIFTESESVLRSEVRSRAHLGQPGQQRSRGSRYLISPNTSPVPGDKGCRTPNRAQNPGVAGDWEGQR